MYVNIISHDSGKSVSSSNIIQYLDKENTLEKLKNEELILEGKEINFNSVENFFNQDFDPNNIDNPNSNVNVFDAAQKLDENRGTQNLKSSNFYMLNISPSQLELEHMEKISVEELKSRGLDFEVVKNDSTALEFFHEQKDQLMKLQMKLYTKEIMIQYADLMDREIYSNQEGLPSDSERKILKPIIDERYQNFLKDKGIVFSNSQEIQFLHIEKYSIKHDYEHGKIFTIYSPEIDKNVDLFVPNGSYKLDENKLVINEVYYSEKYQTIVENDKYRRDQIHILGEAKMSYDYFTDYVIEDKISISYQYEEFDKELKLYFSPSEITLENGVCFIPKSTYNDKLHDAKSKFLAKEFSDVKSDILSKTIQASGFDVSKTINDKGLEVYVNPERVPTKDQMKQINIKASVEFNKYLVDKNYLQEKKGFKVSDWTTRTSVDAQILAESSKAKLVLIKDERLKEHVQMWIPNYAIVDKKSNELILDEEGKNTILTNFYENKIQEIVQRENEEKLNFVDFTQNEQNKSKFVKNEESISFRFDDTGLKEPLQFSVQLEDVTLSPDGKYYMERYLFEHKYEQHLINQAKKEFNSEYDKITSDVNKEMLSEKDLKKDKETESRFKNFLVEKNILQDSKKNENYQVRATVVEEKNNSVLVAYKAENKEEEVRLWVNKELISKSGENGIYFKDKQTIEKLLDKAVLRDDQKKQIVKIDFQEIESEEKKHKEETYTSLTFYKKVEGLAEPVKFSFKESDIKKEDGQYFVEKHKLDYKLDNAVKFGITKEFGNVKDEIKNEVWKENGFDTTKRKLTGNDLLYYSKIETERKYNHKDKSVIKNKPILTQIRKYEKSNNPLDKLKIGELQKQLLCDKYTNEIIDEGVKKGGLNYHSHIVVSRHDKTSVNPKDKVSMSPNANHKDGQTNNGAKVGFNRDEFAKRIEKVFDEKFEYERPEQQKYEKINQNKKDLAEKVSDKAKGYAKGKIKKELLKHTGMNIVKSELNPTQKIKSELMPLPIPTSFPTGKLDAVIKIIKMAKSLIVDKGIHY